MAETILTSNTLYHVYTPGIDQSDAGTNALHLMAVDALGTVRGFINDNGGQAVTDTFSPYAYGAPRTRTGSDAFSLAWGGADGFRIGRSKQRPYTWVSQSIMNLDEYMR